MTEPEPDLDDSEPLDAKERRDAMLFLRKPIRELDDPPMVGAALPASELNEAEGASVGFVGMTGTGGAAFSGLGGRRPVADSSHQPCQSHTALPRHAHAWGCDSRCPGSAILARRGVVPVPTAVLFLLMCLALPSRCRAPLPLE